jgi:large subunit ribosomal protein L6
MSRIGKLAIKLDPKVKASVASGAVALEGPKGKMKVSLPERITADVKDGQIHVNRPDDTREARALHGLARSLLANAAKGRGRPAGSASSTSAAWASAPR